MKIPAHNHGVNNSEKLPPNAINTPIKLYYNSQDIYLSENNTLGNKVQAFH